MWHIAYTISVNPYPLSPGLSGLQAHAKPTYAQFVFLGFYENYWEFHLESTIFEFLGLKGVDFDP
jgi:hypothetical protein